jgi:hypothetical protein
LFKNFLWDNRVSASKKGSRIEKYLLGQETWQEPKSFFECDHDVKIYSQIKERKSTSSDYQDNQMLCYDLKSFKLSNL